MQGVCISINVTSGVSVLPVNAWNVMSILKHGKVSDLLSSWTLSVVPYSETIKQRFGNWIRFRPQVKRETPIMLSPLEIDNLICQVQVDFATESQSARSWCLEVMLPSACSFILDGLTFSCRYIYNKAARRRQHNLKMY
jgi:hypothetical protein